MILDIRGYKIRCYAKAGNKGAYVRLYSGYSDERLASMEQEQANVRVQGQDTSIKG